MGADGEMNTVLIPDWLVPPADVEAEVLGDDCNLILATARHHDDIGDEVWAAADAIILFHTLELSAGAIAKLDRCQVIVRAGAGHDNVDLAAAKARGIPVCNVPDYGTNDVADHALALLLALRRGLFDFDAAIRTPPYRWDWQSGGELRRVADQVIGIIGLGRIGTAMVLRLKALGARVVFYDPYVADGYDKAIGVERLDLDDLLKCADTVSLHVPLTHETRGMVDDAFLGQLKPDAVLINTARGAVIDFRALERALRSGRLRAAGLDVLPEEPPSDDDPLIAAWRAGEAWVAHRLVVTPHAAFFNREAYRELRWKAAAEVRRVLQGAPPRNLVEEGGGGVRWGDRPRGG
jgi:phosphoglycerate dehydrogenase-like enzyme